MNGDGALSCPVRRRLAGCENRLIEPSTAIPTAALRFEALYYPELVHPVNPEGDIGLITLWSPFRTVERKLREVAPELLDPGQSRLAVIANLYGNGMYAMFCNLLFNPQVSHLIAIGEGLGLGTVDEIAAFLDCGLEDAALLGKPVKRVPGTERVFPAVEEFDADRLRERVSFRYLGRLSTPGLGEELSGLVRDLPREDAVDIDRVRVELPTAVADDYAYRPSEVAGHQVVRRRPLDCWEELVVRAVRFGRPVVLSNGPRLELLNTEGVSTEAGDGPPDALSEVGFDIERFRAYQRRILQPDLPEG